MSDTVTLTLRAPIVELIEAECIAADRFAALGENEIAQLSVFVGRQQQKLGDWFDVRGGHSSRVRVVGDVRRVAGIGCGMSSGDLVIDGNVGSRLGAAMSGGTVEVHGSVSDDAGLDMSGGSIHIHGDAGDRAAAAGPGAARGMTGGEIVIRGSVGADAGARMRRGLLVVGGDTGDRSARAMIAGTMIVLGDTGAEPATSSKRGTLVVGGNVDVPATYRYACTFASPHVRLVLTHVVRRYGIPVEARFLEQPYRRFCGDASTIGRGEILQCVVSA